MFGRRNPRAWPVTKAECSERSLIGCQQRDGETAGGIEPTDKCEACVPQFDPGVQSGTRVGPSPNRPARERDCGRTVLVTRYGDDLRNI
jgi:hypothetical protein